MSFESWATNLVPNDTNNTTDVFLKAPVFPGDTLPECQPSERPLLYLSHESFWASYAEYLYRQMSVNFTISNQGPDTAYAAAITGSTNTNGAVLITATPVAVGDVDPGASKSVTVKYSVPAGTIHFDADLTGTATDSCGTIFIYPPE